MRQLVGIIILLLLASCKENAIVDRNMTMAEALMEEYPDSALIVLQSIDKDEFELDRQKALYALLLTQAYAKNYIFETNDSLISIATQFFDKEENPSEYIKSHFYKASIFYNRKEYSSAINVALDALEVALTIQDDYYLAKIYELIADIYYESFNMDASILYREKARKYYIKTEKQLNAIYTLVEIARSHTNNYNYEKAVSLLDSVPSIYSGNDSVFLGFYYSSYLRPLLNLKQYDRAIDCFHKAENYWGDLACSMLEYTTVSLVYLEKGVVDSAEFYLDKYTQVNPAYDKNERYHSAKSRYYRKTKNHELALLGLERKLELQNDKLGEVLPQNVAFTERNYYNNKSEIEKIRATRQTTIIVFLAIFLFMVVCVFVVYNIYTTIHRKNQAEEQMFEVINLKSQLLNSQSIISDLSTSLEEKEAVMSKQNKLVERLFSEHFISLNNLSSEYFCKKDSEHTKLTIIRDFEKEIAKIKQPQYIEKIQSIVNECRDNIINKIRMQFPKFKESDIVFLTLVLANFSPKAICLITDIKIGNYYNKWTRLRARISESNSPDKEFFLKSIERTLPKSL